MKAEYVTIGILICLGGIGLAVYSSGEMNRLNVLGLGRYLYPEQYQAYESMYGLGMMTAIIGGILTFVGYKKIDRPANAQQTVNQPFQTAPMPQQQTPMFCNICGKPLEGGGFCKYCGAKIG